MLNLYVRVTDVNENESPAPVPSGKAEQVVSNLLLIQIFRRQSVCGSAEANATNTYGHISDWNVSGVTNMSSAFKDREFNVDISKWDVSSVTNMGSMFRMLYF